MKGKSKENEESRERERERNTFYILRDVFILKRMSVSLRKEMKKGKSHGKRCRLCLKVEISVE